MEQWWAGMTAFEHVYWMMAIASSTLLLIQLIIASISGFDFHTGDVGHHDISGGHFQLLTVRNLVGFFAIMSWSGIAFNHASFPIWLTILLSILIGIIMMVVMALLFFVMIKLENDGTIDMQNAVGRTAIVYLTIPAARKSYGIIRVNMQEKMFDINAITDDSKDIENNSAVHIKEISNNQAIVERL